MSSVNLEPQDLPEPAASNHGKTRAAWVLNTAIVVGGTAIGVGIAFDRHLLTWIGAGICVLGLIAGAVLRALGHGQPLK